MPANPPHILPAGGAPDAAATGAEPDGDGGGREPELTTPVGVNTGSALVVGEAVAEGVVVVGVATAGVSAGGLGCEEQATSAVWKRTAVYTNARVCFPMRLAIATRAALVEPLDGRSASRTPIARGRFATAPCCSEQK